MKRLLSICVLATCFALSASAAGACEIYHAIEFQTDFGFQLGGKTFPPGNYAIERTDLQYAEPLRIVKAGQAAGIDFDTEDIEATEIPTSDHVVFDVTNGQHVLSEIWLDSEKVGCKVIQEAPKGDHEKKKVEGKKKKHSSQEE